MRHRYEGSKITVFFDPARCTHAAECLRRLRSVFDTLQRPWVQPDNASPEKVAETILRCPTGALHYERKDGGPEEEPPAENTIRILAHGPLYVTGRLAVLSAEGERLLDDTRMALCRCGRSRQQPFCDNGHYGGFRSDGKLSAPGEATPVAPCGELQLTLIPDGPILFKGPVTVISADEAVRLQCSRGSLCRCGASQRQPFCDGSHKAAGFRAE